MEGSYGGLSKHDKFKYEVIKKVVESFKVVSLNCKIAYNSSFLHSFPSL